MSHSSTWEEPDRSTPRQVAVLTTVLHYDDLLADASSALVLPDAAQVFIGRAPDAPAPRSSARDPASLELADRWASGRHAAIQRTGDDRAGPADLIQDEGSRNGTYVNGERLRGRQRLISGDLIEVGHTLLCYRTMDDAIAKVLSDSGPIQLGPTRTRSPEVATLVQDIERIAPSREPILVLGETGVGKEVVARMVHDKSGRRGPLVTLDCGAIPESLFEATLFGHRRGAFTGAGEARVGEIVRGSGGTVFLDEAANMSMASQAKLLRVIEEGSVLSLGGVEPERVDVRWIAATNSRGITNDGEFRADLLRRLAGFVARVPPLRKRREDLGTLAAHVLREAGISRASITAPAGRRLFCDSFAGNVRQLRSTLRAAALLVGGGPIDIAQLDALAVDGADDDDPRRAEPGAAGPASEGGGRRGLSSAAPEPRRGERAIDRKVIEDLLDTTGGNVVRAAEQLGVHPRQLYRYIKRFEVPLDRFRGTE